MGLSDHREEPGGKRRLKSGGVHLNQWDLESEELLSKNIHFSKEWVEICDVYLKLHNEFWITHYVMSAAYVPQGT